MLMSFLTLLLASPNRIVQPLVWFRLISILAEVLSLGEPVINELSLLKFYHIMLLTLFQVYNLRFDEKSIEAHFSFT